MVEAVITLLEIFGIFALAALLVAARGWWVRLVESCDPDWYHEGRPRW